MVVVKSNGLVDVKIAIAISLLAWPISYFVDTGIKAVNEDKQTVVLASVGFILLITIIYVVKSLSKLDNWIGYVFTLFAFTSMISLIIGLEFKEWISGFMSQYLLIGELYLNCPWGCAISLFDGLCLYPMYLVLIYRISNRQPWRSVGIYWGSALFNSMIVLLFGIAAGHHAPTFCILLNVPYTLIPIFIVVRLLSKDEGKEWSSKQIASKSILFNIALVIGLFMSAWLVLVKGMLSIGSQFTIFQDVLSHERALLDTDPAPFALVQSLVYLFYVFPILIISLLYVFRKIKPQFVWDISLINGAIALQGQFSFIVTALDSKTPSVLQSDITDWKFWMNNLTLLILPQILLWSLYENNAKSIRDIKEKLK